MHNDSKSEKAVVWTGINSLKILTVSIKGFPILYSFLVKLPA